MYVYLYDLLVIEQIFSTSKFFQVFIFDQIELLVDSYKSRCKEYNSNWKPYINIH